MCVPLTPVSRPRSSVLLLSAPRNGVCVCLFLCVPVLAYSQVYMNLHEKVKSNVVFSVTKR